MSLITVSDCVGTAHLPGLVTKDGGQCPHYQAVIGSVAVHRVVKAAINAAKVDGLTRCYFRVNKWEGELKELFLRVPEQLAAEHLAKREALIDDMNELSRLYRTSRSRPHFPLILKAVHEEVSQGGWAATPPKLLNCTAEELGEVARVVDRVMNYVRTKKPTGEKDNYSFSTKFLHYLYPETFAIYDSQAWKRGSE